MAPRAYWKGFLRLSLVSCPIALYPATSEREKIHFHQLNRKTGNRIQHRKVDSDTGREVDKEDIIKAYEKSKGEYIAVEPEELEAVEIETKRTIEIDQFVDRKEIDELYFANPYYIVPDGEAGVQAFTVIRDAIEEEGMIAIGRVVFTSREHVIGLEARGKGSTRKITSVTSQVSGSRRICWISPSTSSRRKRVTLSPRNLKTDTKTLLKSCCVKRTRVKKSRHRANQGLTT